MNTTTITTETIKANVSFDLLSQAKLNNFNAFNRALFTEEKWNELGMKCFEDYYFESFDLVVLPYSKPKKKVEYQINHYVMWGVIAQFQLLSKPDKTIFLDEMKDKTFTIDELKPWTKYIHSLSTVAVHNCWACEFSSQNDIVCECDACPIWDGRTSSFLCERSSHSPYYRWCQTADDYDDLLGSKYRDAEDLQLCKEQIGLYAQELMETPWGTYIDYEDDDIEEE